MQARVELHLTTQQFLILFYKICLMQDIYALGIDVHHSKYTWLPILFRHNDVTAHLITKKFTVIANPRFYNNSQNRVSVLAYF